MVEFASVEPTFKQDVASTSAGLLGETVEVVYLDPLDEDQPIDPVILLTHRQLCRLLFIATQTGSRFTREGSMVDPAAWLFAPRELFDGCAAVQACQHRLSFARAIAFHALSIGFDADPAEVDDLFLDDTALSSASSPSSGVTGASSADLVELSFT